MKFLSGYKTYLTGIAAIIGAVAGYANNALDAPSALQLIVTALMGMFIRHGVTAEANK